MSSTTAELSNAIMGGLDLPGGKEKVAAALENFIRDKLREKAFSRKILPPERVTKSTPGVQVSTNHDTLIYIDEVEPNSRAMAITFRGEPTANYIRAPRYEIPFFLISSERYEKLEEELLAYRMSLTKVIEDHTVMNIQEVEDYRFIVHVEAAVQATGNIVRGEQATADAVAFGAGNGLRGRIQRDDLISLFNLLDTTRRTLDKVLINSEDSNDVMRWTIEDWGDQKQGEITIKGFTYQELLGRKMVRTIKTDIIQTGNIYGFTDSEFLGRFLILNNTKFWIDKKARLLTWQAWETIAMGFGNVASMAKLELYNGQGGANDASDALISEDDVGTEVYNQVDDGVYFPSVVQY